MNQLQPPQQMQYIPNNQYSIYDMDPNDKSIYSCFMNTNKRNEILNNFRRRIKNEIHSQLRLFI